jgi:hypothetical protein
MVLHKLQMAYAECSSLAWSTLFPCHSAYFAFIVKGPGYDPKIHRASLDSAQFHTVVVGVSSVTEAAQVAVKLRETGSQMIELSGGFSGADADQIQTRVGPNVLVGVVRYSKEQERKLAEMFNL